MKTLALKMFIFALAFIFFFIGIPLFIFGEIFDNAVSDLINEGLV